MTRSAWALALSCLLWRADARADAARDRARAVLQRTPVIDGHNDVPWKLREKRGGKLAGFTFERLEGDDGKLFNTDLARMRAGGVGGQFWSVYVPEDLKPDEAVRSTFEQIDLARRLIEANPARMAFVETAAEARAAMRAGRVASLLGAEGGHSIANSLPALRAMRRLGVRYLTIAYNNGTDWADGRSNVPRVAGLSPFGREVVREMNRIGMLVDLSHASPLTMRAALDVAAAPVIFSHSSARAVTEHGRNVPDDVLVRLRANGGIVMVTFVPGFVSARTYARGLDRIAAERRGMAAYPEDPARREALLADWDRAHPDVPATIADVADHIDHVRKLAGTAHVGIGSDFDGTDELPTGLTGVDGMVDLFAELARRGYSDADLAAIASGNILRVLDAADAAAARLRRERGPSEATITALDPPASSPR